MKKQFSITVLKKYIIGILLVFVGVILGLFVRRHVPVAIVNGEPISRVEFTENVLEKSGKTVLQDMIVRTMLYKEAGKKKIKVTDEEIRKQVEKSGNELKLNGSSLEIYLINQNISMDEFKQEVADQLLIKKMFEKDIKVSREDVELFYKANNITKGTGAILLSQEIAIRQAITQYLLRQKFYEWGRKQLQKAEIVQLIKL